LYIVFNYLIFVILKLRYVKGIKADLGYVYPLMRFNKITPHTHKSFKPYTHI